MTQTRLKRSLSLPLITFYGLGNILGAGIYVLVGKVAGEAGYFAPLAFLFASIVAAISAFTYAELSARYPVSAGEAVYIHEGFGMQSLSLLVGVLITLAGILSAATIAHGFAGYVQVFFDLPPWLTMSVLIVVLGLLAAWGINQSVKVAAILTLAEISGLLLIVFVGADQLSVFSQMLDQLSALPETSWYQNFPVFGVFSGAFLAFYAYIGFEDMVNIAEEVKDPQRTMPRAIIICVVVSTVLYGGVTLVALSVLTPAELAQSNAPLSAVYEKATGEAPLLITVIGVFAVVNGALIQLIMASRLIYGMASRQWLPAKLARVNPLTHTPINSTVLTVLLMLLFAHSLKLVELAEMTSYLVLLVFALVNLALIRIKRRLPDPQGVWQLSIWLPRLGFVTTSVFLLVKIIVDIA